MNYLKYILLISGIILSLQCLHAEERSYIPSGKVAGVNQPKILLNGVWDFKYSPDSKWTTIRVPGEAAMQGYAIEHDKPFFYRKTLNLPADYKNKRVILRFDGVYSYAKLYVNGVFVREHRGGFTRWDTDITSFVKTGKKNEIQLEVIDPVDEISYASGYAHHPVGGILRDVSVFVLPQTHLFDFRVETHLDSLFKDANMVVAYLPEVSGGNAEIVYTLSDPDGRPVTLPQNTFPLRGGGTSVVNEMKVQQPVKWDAEHPNLYTLTVAVRQEGKEINRFSKKIGFRDIKIKGNRMLVNGSPVKLRGANRHDIHPELGRATTNEIDSLDAVMFKKANMNFVRTSHYPPSERFIEYCDRFGIYLECETAVCFVLSHRQINYRPGDTQDNTAYAGQYLSQCREMVKAFNSHPSVTIWSIANESTYGKNFQDSYDWVKAYDRTRPVIFSYPGTVKKEQKIYDILSMHYQDVNGNRENEYGISVFGFQGHGIPVLFDEWAHPACYTYATLQHDPNIREFWGKSIDMMWNGIFGVDGGLGGAIWGYVDEIFMLPKPKVGTPFWKEFSRTAKPDGFQGDCVGYGEWGIVDIWRRAKPEFWSAKKAYSPVRLLTEQVSLPIQGERLALTVHNRFDHTNLKEIKATYTYKGVEKEMAMPPVEPHRRGMLLIPGEAWEDGETLTIRFFTRDNELIDASAVMLGKEKIVLPAANRTGTLNVEETATQILVKGNGFEIPFDKETGLIRNAVSNGQVIIEKGPFLNLDINLNHLSGAEVRKRAAAFTCRDDMWKKTRFSHERKNNLVNITLTGTYGELSVDICMTISPEGKMSFNYVVVGEPNGYLREAGLKFYLPKTVENLDWKRNGYWNFYPEGEFAGNSGNASLYESRQAAYSQKPVQNWAQDTHNYYYWADAGANCAKPLTLKAKGMKENIYWYTLSDNSKQTNLSILSSDAALACRMDKRADEQLILFINNRWDYPEIAWGNYCKLLEAVPNYGTITVLFN